MAVTQIRGNTQIISNTIDNSRLLNLTIDNTKISATAAIALSKLAALTASRALVSDGSGVISVSTVTSTELGHLSGVTSAIQTQLDDKANETLNNLTTTAINTSLVSDTDNTDDLGSASINWKDTHAKRLISSTAVTVQASSGNVILSPSGSNTVDVSSKRITSVATPTAGTDAANKDYVDALSAGLDIKASVRLATTAALSANTAAGSGVGKTLTADANGALSVDGVAVVIGDRILVKNETPASDNGIYTVTATGDGSNPYVLTRATDADGTPSGEVTAGLFTFVEEGTANQDTGWVLSTDNPITVDTTALAFTQFSQAGVIVAGAGLLKTGNTIDVQTADTSMTINADSIQVNVNSTGGLEVSSGLRIKTDTATANTIGVTVVSNGAGVKFDANSFADSGSETLALASGVAGNGLALSSGVLSVNVAAAGGLEIATDNLQIKKDTVTANTIGVTSTSDGAGVLFDPNSFTDSGSETLALASGVAGAGLALTSGVLSVNVDASTIEINADTLRVKDLGITTAKLAAGAVTYAKTSAVTREVPSGTINGSNVTFTLASTPATAGSEHVFLNGILQNVGGSNDYTISGDTITFNTAPATGDVLLVSYWA